MTLNSEEYDLLTKIAEKSKILETSAEDLEGLLLNLETLSRTIEEQGREMARLSQELSQSQMQNG